MMGQHAGQKELFSYGIDLERRVRADHPLRRVRASIDFTCARAAVAHTYGGNGNVSVDPAVLLKLMFLLSHENVRSERELVRRLPERLDWLWFLGYGPAIAWSRRTPPRSPGSARPTARRSASSMRANRRQRGARPTARWSARLIRMPRASPKARQAGRHAHVTSITGWWMIAAE